MSCFIIIFVSKKVENSNAEYGNQYAVESVESGSLVIWEHWLSDKLQNVGESQADHQEAGQHQTSKGDSCNILILQEFFFAL